MSNINHNVKANAMSRPNGKLSVGMLIEAKKLADRIELEQAHEALSVLAKLK